MKSEKKLRKKIKKMQEFDYGVLHDIIVEALKNTPYSNRDFSILKGFACIHFQCGLRIWYSTFPVLRFSSSYARGIGKSFNMCSPTFFTDVRQWLIEADAWESKLARSA